MAIAYLPCVCQLVQALNCLFPTITLKWSITLVILILYRYRLLITYHNILKSVKHNGDYDYLNKPISISSFFRQKRITMNKP